MPTSPLVQAQAARARSASPTAQRGVEGASSSIVGASASGGRLHALGYTEGQINKLRPEAQPAIQGHHAVLVGHGFTHGDICRISSRYQSLEVVASRYRDLVAVLLELTPG